MAKLEYTIIFDATLVKKILRQAEANVFAIMFDEDAELQYILNINGIADSDENIEEFNG